MVEAKKYSIKYWAENDRPREKLAKKGANVLSDAELIAILIGSGNKEESAVEVARKILNSFENNLIELGRSSLETLMNFKGIGEAKAISISAALELGRRRRNSESINRKKITSSKDAFDFFGDSLSDIPIEEFWVLLLNRQNKIISKELVSRGGVSGTVVDPKVIFNLAISNLSSGIILCHNHPSGNLQPSQADKAITQKIKKGCELMDMSLLDHIIVADNQYFSFSDQGIL